MILKASFTQLSHEKYLVCVSSLIAVMRQIQNNYPTSNRKFSVNGHLHLMPCVGGPKHKAPGHMGVSPSHAISTARLPTVHHVGEGWTYSVNESWVFFECIIQSANPSFPPHSLSK